MSSGKIASLHARRNELSRQEILDAALRLLEEGSVGELTARAVARRANVAERTVFRYFTSREALLDAIAEALRVRLATPPAPRSLAELLAMPRALFARLEATRSLTLAALHSELFHRMRETEARVRWKAIGQVVDQAAPRQSERVRKIAATNIRYWLSATTWHYYRFYFGFTLEESIAAAETAIRDHLAGLKIKG
jgi:AcrR family transcriptional regulator